MVWVSAEDLLAAFKIRGSSTTRAICKRAHGGMMHTRATRYVVGAEIPVLDHEIPDSFWIHEGGAAMDQDWLRGDFSAWIEIKQVPPSGALSSHSTKVHAKAFGVRFSKEDAVNMGAVFPPTGPTEALDAFPEDKGTEPEPSIQQDCDQVARLAKAFDDECVPSRALSAKMIADRWSSEWGTVPKVESVRVLMAGQPKGRRQKNK